MGVKRIRFMAAFVAVAALCIAVMCFAVLRLVTAQAETADSIEGNFESGGASGWTLNEFAVTSQDGVQVISSGSVTSENELRNFMVQISFGTLEQGFTFFFGSGENACSVTFDGAQLRLNGLQTANGGNSESLNSKISEGAIVQIEVVGGEISVGIKQKNEPYDVLGTPVAVFEYADGVSLSDGKIGVSAFEGAAFCVHKISAYSLNATVNIETENYVPPANSGETEKKTGCGCGSSAIAGTSIAVSVVIIAVAAVLCGIRRKNEKSN